MILLNKRKLFILLQRQAVPHIIIHIHTHTHTDTHVNGQRQFKKQSNMHKVSTVSIIHQLCLYGYGSLRKINELR